MARRVLFGDGKLLTNASFVLIRSRESFIFGIGDEYHTFNGAILLFDKESAAQEFARSLFLQLKGYAVVTTNDGVLFNVYERWRLNGKNEWQLVGEDWELQDGQFTLTNLSTSSLLHFLQ